MSRLKPLDDRLDKHFSVSEARSVGASRNRLHASDLVAPFHGTRTAVATDLSDLAERCRAYLPVAPRTFAFSHVTAARLYGIPIPRRLEAQAIHVSVPDGRTPPRRAGVVGHRGLAELRARGDLPLVTPEAAWAQLADRLTVDELVIAADYLVRRKRPLSTLDLLARQIDAIPRRRGTVQARAAFRDVRAGTDSPRESRLRLLIVRSGLPEPVVRHAVFHQGAFVGTPDLAYVQERIAIEYEGQHHRTDVDAYEDDIHRRELFRRAGWVCFLVTAARLARRPALVGELRALLVERGYPASELRKAY